MEEFDWPEDPSQTVSLLVAMGGLEAWTMYVQQDATHHVAHLHLHPIGVPGSDERYNAAMIAVCCDPTGNDECSPRPHILYSLN